MAILKDRWYICFLHIRTGMIINRIVTFIFENFYIFGDDFDLASNDEFDRKFKDELTRYFDQPYFMIIKKCVTNYIKSDINYFLEIADMLKIIITELQTHHTQVTKMSLSGGYTIYETNKTSYIKLSTIDGITSGYSRYPHYLF